MEQKNAANVQKVINPQTFYQSLKLVGQTLGMPDKKFQKLIKAPMTYSQVVIQREEVGMKVLDQILDEEIVDLEQLLFAIKKIQSFCKQRIKQEKAIANA